MRRRINGTDRAGGCFETEPKLPPPVARTAQSPRARAAYIHTEINCPANCCISEYYQKLRSQNFLGEQHPCDQIWLGKKKKFRKNLDCIFLLVVISIIFNKRSTKLGERRDTRNGKKHKGESERDSHIFLT